MIFIINSAIASLYKEPTKNCGRVDEVLYGMHVTAIKNEGDYVYIRTGYRYEGWINKKHLLKPLDSHKVSLIKYVSNTTTDVLTLPKVQANLLITLTLGCTVNVMKEESDGWVKVFLADGTKGYMRSAHLSLFPKNCTEEVMRKNICKTATNYLDVQYRWGGKSPQGIDCSGLCFMAYYLNGINIYRDADIKEGFAIKKIPQHEAKKGDLAFFPGHVGMLLDENNLIHSSEGGNGVKIEPFTKVIAQRGEPTKFGASSFFL